MNIRDDIQKIQKRVRNLEKVVCNNTTDDEDKTEDARTEDFSSENGKGFVANKALALKRGVATELAVCTVNEGESVTLLNSVMHENKQHCRIQVEGWCLYDDLRQLKSMQK